MANKQSSPKLDQKERCRWCNTPFEEIPESPNIPGVCEYCEEHKNAIGKVELRKSASVELEHFNLWGDKHASLMATEWPNQEGIDINIYQGEGKPEKNIELTYGEAEAILNIVHSFNPSILVIYSD